MSEQVSQDATILVDGGKPRSITNWLQLLNNVAPSLFERPYQPVKRPLGYEPRFKSSWVRPHR